MVCWHDDERWVAHAVIGLITAADTIVLSDSESAPAATNLLNHLNPCAQVRSSAPPTASAHPSSPGDLDAQSDWRPQMWTTPATGPVQSSVFESSQPLNREKLIQILADISQEVLRVEGVVYLSDQPDTPFHLHVSAGLAALDARDHWAQEGAKTTNLIVTTQPESGNRHGLVLQSLRSAEQAPHRHR
ncbi:GTP-binding protein [Candidatus Nanopelagicales bacterium]|nr:GTP-binding protein [Candidatus Nanopelagicales bacterium]